MSCSPAPWVASPVLVSVLFSEDPDVALPSPGEETKAQEVIYPRLPGQCEAEPGCKPRSDPNQGREREGAGEGKEEEEGNRRGESNRN